MNENNNTEGIVLVVDDEDCVRMTLHEILVRNGFKVLQAEDGETAIRIAKQVSPHLILLDVCMPGLDGYETYECLKQDKKTKDIPVVYISAQYDPKAQVKGLKLGSLDYIVKPFDRLTLLQKVITHVKQRKLQIELVELEKALLKKNEQERESIEYDMHEDLCQSLAALGMLIDKFDTSDIKKYFYQTLNKALGLAHKAYPVCMQMGRGIVSALKELSSAKREVLGISCSLEYFDESIPDCFTETALQIYRIAQRSIRNAIKYSHASIIKINLTRDNDNINMQLEYDGANFFDVRNDEDMKLEIDIMSHLANIFDASYDIKPGNNGKTIVTVTVPYTAINQKSHSEIK